MLQSVIWCLAVVCTSAWSVIAVTLPPPQETQAVLPGQCDGHCTSNLDCGENQQCCRYPPPRHPLDPVPLRRAALDSGIRSLRQLPVGPCVELCPPGGCPSGQICASNGCGHHCVPGSTGTCQPYKGEDELCDEFCGCAPGLTCDFDSLPFGLPNTFPITVLVGTCRACAK